MIDRRGFFKVCMATLAAIAVAAVPAFPKDAVVSEMAQYRPKKKHPKDVVCNCPDFVYHAVMRDYSTGEIIKFEDLSKDKSCNICIRAKQCTQTGKEYVRLSGQFVPEKWNRKLQARWYSNFMKGYKT